MSTKAIREALLTMGLTHDMTAARAELAAIEKALEAVRAADKDTPGECVVLGFSEEAWGAVEAVLEP